MLKSFFDEEFLRFPIIALLKFRFSEKTTKIWSYLPFLFDDVITEWKIASNFCGILRKTGLQRARSKASLISFFFPFFQKICYEGERKIYGVIEVKNVDFLSVDCMIQAH